MQKKIKQNSEHTLALEEGGAMNFEQWEKHYKPIENNIDSNASFEGIMFETYGAEFAFIASQPVNKIWTLIDGDEDTLLVVSGFRFVNRIGYFVTVEPWTDKFMEIEIERED